MHGFEQRLLVKRGAFWSLYRDGATTFMLVEGEIDDTRSAEWQQAAQAHFDAHGYPRFHTMDVSGVNPVNSMSGRARTASFIRRSLERLEYSVVLTTMSAGPLVVCRAILRVVGMPNIQLLSDERAFEATLRDMRAGRNPYAHVASAG